MTQQPGLDPSALFDMISKLGFPLIFILGQLREWWYVKPHVDLMANRIVELSKGLESAETNARRATDLAEQSNAIAAQALELSETSASTLQKIDDNVTSLREDISKLMTRL